MLSLIIGLCVYLGSSASVIHLVETRNGGMGCMDECDCPLAYRRVYPVVDTFACGCQCDEPVGPAGCDSPCSAFVPSGNSVTQHVCSTAASGCTRGADCQSTQSTFVRTLNTSCTRQPPGDTSSRIYYSRFDVLPAGERLMVPYGWDVTIHFANQAGDCSLTDPAGVLYAQIVKTTECYGVQTCENGKKRWCGNNDGSVSFPMPTSTHVSGGCGCLPLCWLFLMCCLCMIM